MIIATSCPVCYPTMLPTTFIPTNQVWRNQPIEQLADLIGNDFRQLVARILMTLYADLVELNSAPQYGF